MSYLMYAPTEQLIDLARQMLAGDLNVVEGSIAICLVRRELPAKYRDSELLSPFIAFDSELDAFPLGEARARWSPAALREKDAQLAGIADLAQPELLSACKQLIKKW